MKIFFIKVKRQILKPLRQIRKILDKIFMREFVLSSYGIKLAPNWGDPAFEVYYDGLYGRELVEIITNQEKNFYFLDIGANQGLYAILAAKNKNCIKSFAFEPIPRTAYFLRKNIILNNQENKISIFEEAISNIKTEMEIKYKDPAKASLLKARQNNLKNKCKIKVVNHKKLNFLAIKENKNVIVKIDVEGLEEVVINEIIKTNFFDNITEIIYEVIESEKWNKLVNYKNIKSSLEQKGFKKFKKLALYKSNKTCKYDMHAKR